MKSKYDYTALKLTLCLIAPLFFVISCSSGSHQIKAEKISIQQTAGKIDTSLQNISYQAMAYADYIHKLYLDKDKYLPITDRSKYKLSSNGVLYKPVDDGKSAVFVSGYVPVTRELMDIVYFTEPMDSLMMSIVKQNPDVTQIYYNDRNSYNRIYPFFDVMIQYQPKMNIPSFNFYYLADQTHNPGRKAVWVKEPYADPAGRGWMISCIAPVYTGNELAGVAGLDVTINGITDRYIYDKQKNYLLTTDTGVIISACDNLVALLSLPRLREYKYMETIKSDRYLQDDYNLLKHRTPQTRQLGVSALKENLDEFEFVAKDGKYKVIVAVIPTLNWKLIQLIKL